jgi:predicted hydrocarbon binding protein
MADIRELGGVTLGGYRLQECLGHGTNTAVYKASDESGGTWALKLVEDTVEPDDQLLQRLQHQARELGELEDPAIVSVRGAGRDGGYTFAAMPMVEGSTLADLLARGPLDTERAWTVLSSIAQALDQARRRGFTYQVLKPSNMLFDGSGQLRLAEFGIAGRLVGQTALAATEYRLRFSQYLAPEQLDGVVPDGQADVYAVAVLVFELLTGTTLFDLGTPAEVLRAATEGRPPSAHARNEALPAAIDDVLSRALARDPAARQRSVWELLDQLVSLPEPPRPGGLGLGDGESAAGVLRRMGVPVLHFHGSPILNSFASRVLRHARQVSGERWPEVLAAAGLERYQTEPPPDNGNRDAQVQDMSNLADGFEDVFGPEARHCLREVGQAASEAWMKATQRRPFWMMGRPPPKVADALVAFTSSLDRVRGEPLHVWRQIDERQYWTIHYANLTALGRRHPENRCHFWIGAYEGALRWARLGDLWTVDEVECGCATGTGTCVFTVQRAD